MRTTNPIKGGSLILDNRIAMTEMPVGPLGHVLTGQGAGADPVYAVVTGAATIVRKTADQTINNNNVLQNDTHLLFAMAINEVWLVDLHLIFESSAVADFKGGLSLPVGAIWNGFMAYVSTTDIWSGNQITTGDVFGLRGIGAGFSLCMAIIRILVTNGANAGNFQFQWAQSTAEATNTILRINSCLVALKVA